MHVKTLEGFYDGLTKSDNQLNLGEGGLGAYGGVQEYQDYYRVHAEIFLTLLKLKKQSVSVQLTCEHSGCRFFDSCYSLHSFTTQFLQKSTKGLAKSSFRRRSHS